MPGLNPTQQDIDQFVAITQASPEDAEHFLATGTTLQGAIEDFYAAQNATGHPSTLDDDQESLTDEPSMSNPEQNEPAQNPSGPRTLGGAAADTALPEGWGQKKKTLGRVGDWGNSGGGSSGPRMGGFGGGDDDDDEEDDEKGQDFYTGGEKSGLAVEDPNSGKGKGHKSLVSNILKQAAEGSKGREEQQPSGSSSAFRGAGNTLGSEDDPAPSDAPAGDAGPRVAPVSSSAFDGLLGAIMGGRQAPPPPEEEEEAQTRSLIFWKDGFSIEDGPLMRYDEPGNKDLLEAIQSGRAPPSLFNVRFNQPLQINVQQRTGENYQAPPKVSKPFEGSGNRLGSAAPEISGSGRSSPAIPGGMPQAGGSNNTGSTGQTASSFELDPSKPTTSIQLRLGDGSKLVAKVNLTHTVGDLRNYISASRPDARPFVLQTTFPTKELSDPNETVEAAKLQNAVVTQRFT